VADLLRWCIEKRIEDSPERQVAIDFLRQLLGVGSLRRALDAEGVRRLGGPEAQACALLEAAGWPRDEPLEFEPLASYDSVVPDSYRKLGNSLESFLKDLIQIEAVRAVGSVRGQLRELLVQRGGEFDRLSLDAALNKLRSTHRWREQASALDEAVRAIAPWRNEKGHDRSQLPTPEPVDAAAAVRTILEVARERYGSLPWHPEGRKPFLVSGGGLVKFRAWSHGESNVRVIILPADRVDQIGPDCLIWNPTGVNPVMEDAEVLART
jgi:hypothetical protein